MIVCFRVPTYSLLTGPSHGIRIGPKISKEPHNVRKWLAKLGLAMVISGAVLDNEIR